MLNLKDVDLRLWKSKMAVGRMAYESGFFTQAAQHFRKALAIIDEKGLPSELLSKTLVDLAKALGSVGQFDEGERLLTQALRLDTQDNATDVELIEDYHQLSLLYWRAHKQEPAVAAINKAWSMFEENPDNVPDELRAKLLKHRAVLSGLSGDYANCERLINQAIDFIRSSLDLGKFCSIYGDSLMVKLMLLIELDRFDEARELYPEALKVLEVSRGETHVKTLAFIDALAHLAQEKGLNEESEFLHSEAKRVRLMLKKKEIY